MKIDARVRYTQKAIRDAFLKLLNDKPIQKITVKELCLEAGINRATFYSHYKNPAALLESIEDDLLAEILKSAHGKDRIDNLFPIIMKHIDICRILFSEHGNSFFLLRMIEKSKTQSIQELQADYPYLSQTQLEYFYEFMAAGTVAVISQWVRSGMGELPINFSNIIDALREQWLNSIGKA